MVIYPTNWTTIETILFIDGNACLSIGLYYGLPTTLISPTDCTLIFWSLIDVTVDDIWSDLIWGREIQRKKENKKFLQFPWLLTKYTWYCCKRHSKMETYCYPQLYPTFVGPVIESFFDIFIKQCFYEMSNVDMYNYSHYWCEWTQAFSLIVAGCQMGGPLER